MRMLPKDYPKWSTVYSYFAQWSKRPGKKTPSLLEQALKNTVDAARVKLGRNAKTTFIIIDAQSVKNTDTAEQKGYDAGKKVSGIKRHLAVDTQGFPHALEVTTAEVTDRHGALDALDFDRERFSDVRGVLVDSGYSGEPFATAVLAATGVPVQVAKRNQLHRFVLMPRHWVVECSFAWLEKCRRLWKNCERKLNTSRQFASLALLVLLVKRL